MLDALFTTDAMGAVFSQRATLQGMLDFEGALARAQSAAGVIPASAAAAIEAACHAEDYDEAEIRRAAAGAGNPAVALVKALTERVAEADVDAARFVHWGATGQDAMDTGRVLQLRAALPTIESGLARASEAAAGLAERHKRTLMVGRTLLQHGLPTTFGLKAAGWMSALDRHRRRLDELKPRLLTLQFGGAVGTLATLGEQGPRVAIALAKDLGLALPDLPWHAHRDRLAEAATALGLLVGTLGKIARDVSLMMQSEVAEAFEPAAPDRGAGGAIAQRRNPAGCAIVLSAATRVPALVSAMLAAMVQEHERGLGGWHAEWETLPQIVGLAAGALEQAVDILEGMEIDAARMRQNLGVTGGQVHAAAVATVLAPQLGARAAQELVEEAAHLAQMEGKGLGEVLEAIVGAGGLLSPEELGHVLDPAQGLGITETLVERALRFHRGETR